MPPCRRPRSARPSERPRSQRRNRPQQRPTRPATAPPSEPPRSQRPTRPQQRPTRPATAPPSEPPRSQRPTRPQPAARRGQQRLRRANSLDRSGRLDRSRAGRGQQRLRRPNSLDPTSGSGRGGRRRRHERLSGANGLDAHARSRGSRSRSDLRAGSRAGPEPLRRVRRRDPRRSSCCDGDREDGDRLAEPVQLELGLEQPRSSSPSNASVIVSPPSRRSRSSSSSRSHATATRLASTSCVASTSANLETSSTRSIGPSSPASAVATSCRLIVAVSAGDAEVSARSTSLARTAVSSIPAPFVDRLEVGTHTPVFTRRETEQPSSHGLQQKARAGPGRAC